MGESREGTARATVVQSRETESERASEIGRIGNEGESELWILIIKFLNFPKRKEG